MKLKIEISGVDKVLEEIQDITKLKNAERAMEKVCALLERSAKQEAPKGDTGELRRSITSKVEKDRNSIEGIVYTPLEYAPYVEYGTGLFAENGKGRKDVPWFIPIGDEFPLSKAEKYHMRIFEAPNGKKFAMSYGQDPHPFMRPALNKNKNKIVEILREGIVE